MNRDLRRKQMWNDFIATYQRVMIETPEKWTEFCNDFRDRYLAATDHQCSSKCRREGCPDDN